MNTPLPTGIVRGKKYRFTVKSAEEAILTIKQRMGDEAKVLSVQQMDGKGLSRFLNAPKLEIVAWVPPLELAEEKMEELDVPEEEVSPSSKAEELEFSVPAEENVVNPSQSPELDESFLEAELKGAMSSDNSAGLRGLRNASNMYQSAPESNNEDQREFDKKDIWSLLERSAFPVSLLQSIRYSSRGEEISKLPISLALAEIHLDMRKMYHELSLEPLTNEIAFLGTPGVGKTTALCKRLASETFLQQKNVHVLKLDSDTPNPDDELSVFCDVIGVPLHRDPIDPEEIPEYDSLYVDLPGAVWKDRSVWEKMKTRMDQLDIRTRVLVIHAAYETDLIQSSFDMGREMGATHLVLTHIDELPNVSKLWPFILRSGLTPLFISQGQNVTSDYSENILDVLMESTFPDALIR